MRKKCILFTRVSTERQDLEQQINSLKNMAKSYGFSDDEMIEISYKESGINLSKDERKGIEDLKSKIESDEDIKCVFVFEMSRLARRMDVLIEMKTYFVEKRINLIIPKEGITLLDENGNMTSSASMVFNVLGTVAEIEMKDKKDRFKRGKENSKKQNKFIGGKVIFGYKVNEDKTFTIDDEKADVIRRIFNDYESGLSFRSIAEKCWKRGEIECENLVSATLFIANIIAREQYTGKKIENRYQLPQIITQEQYDRCKELRENRRKPKSHIKHIYWCKDLLRSKINDYALSPELGVCMYRFHSPDINEKLMMNINYIDSLTWHVVKDYRMLNPKFDADKEIEEADKIKKDAKMKLAQCDVRIDTLKKEKERWLNMYIKGRITEERLDEEDGKLEEEIVEIEHVEKSKYLHVITEMDNRIIYATSWFYEKEFETPKNDEEIFDIIHNDLEKIVIGRLGERFMYEVEYIFKDGIRRKYQIFRSTKRNWVKDEKGNEVEFELLGRFDRKKY